MLRPVLFFTVALGCSDPSVVLVAEPWMTLESEHIVYHTRVDDPLACASYLDEVNTHASMLLDYLGIPASERRRAEWYQYGDEEFDRGASSCSDDTAGCAFGNKGYGKAETLEHELVHMLVSGVGRPPNLFTEGLAVSLSCSPGPILDPAGSEDWRFYLRQRSLSQSASRFVTFLLDTQGPERFVELYRTLPFEATEAEVMEVFERVYGETIDASWQTMRSQPFSRLCAALFACSSPVLETDSLGRSCDSVLPLGRHRTGRPPGSRPPTLRSIWSSTHPGPRSFLRGTSLETRPSRTVG